MSLFSIERIWSISHEYLFYSFQYWHHKRYSRDNVIINRDILLFYVVTYISVYCKVRYFLVKQISLSDSFFALFNFLTWSNKYKIPNHLSGIKLHFKCLQIYLFAFHQRVMFPENHCMIRHLINNVWKRISSNKKDKAIPKYFHNLAL